MRNHVSFRFLLIFLSILSEGQAWGWFSSPPPPNPSGHDHHYHHYDGKAGSGSKALEAEFSMVSLDDPRAVELIENAKRKLGGTNPCWLHAYQTLFSSCSEIFAAEEKRSRLAWDLSVCFQMDTGRYPFPSCGENANMVDCLRKLNNDDHKTYLEFYLETNSICHQLQSKAFRVEVETLVNDLKKSAQFAEEKLEGIEEKSNRLVQSSDQIHESLISIDHQTHQVGNSLSNMLSNLNTVLRHSKELHEQAQGIAISQAELLDGQGKIKETLEADMKMVRESYEGLGHEIEVLQSKSAEIEKEITRYGEAMFSRMTSLQGKADDIASKAGDSLDKQQDLLDGQSKALDGLQSLTRFQSQALEESRATLQRLLEFAQGQHEKLLDQQHQLLQAHDQLAEKSKTILEAQESFESKQATMLTALDRLFALHHALLTESRLIKAFFIYSITVFLLHMFTSTKQTHRVRFKLYIGLSISFFSEFAALRFTSYEVEHQKKFTSIIRLCYVGFAGFQLLFSYFTYRDYEALNHQMLVSLMEKVNGMVKGEDFSWESDADSEVDWISWVDNQLPEEVDNGEDPDYRPPEEVDEEPLGTTPGRRYNLRQRRLLKL